jgi:prepilin peptidase CpaA
LSTVSAYLQVSLLLASIAIVLAAALHDMAARTVPNWMAAALAVFGLMVQATSGHLIAGVVAGLIVFIAAAFCWRRGWMGGGDVKLLGAVAIVVPVGHVIQFVVAVTLTGATLAVIYLIARRVVPAPAARRPAWLIARAVRAECWRINRGGPLPYALAIAAGFLIVTL